MILKIIENIFDSDDMFMAKRSIYDTCLQEHTKLPINARLKILILCNPCHGFGDVIFATKIKQYIKDWYGIIPDIATTTPDLFAKIGEKNVIALSGIKGKQCRRFGNLKAKIGKYDLLFVAPLMADSEILFSDVKKLIPYSSPTNTFFFSEYNDYLDKGFDVNTGIGNGRDGLLFIKTKSSKSDIARFNLGVYAFAYIADSIDDAEECFLQFLNMITEKYDNLEEVVCPNWIKDIDPKLLKKYGKHYNISINTRLGLQNELVLRCDIFPVPNNVMLSLMHYSVRDILLTGDQSITDALSCCSDKNIFYQIAPWKEDFGKNLAKYMPNKFLKKQSTSCGTRDAIFYKFNYDKFIRDWDFRVLGKPKIDAMLCSAYILKKNKQLRRIVEILENSKTVNGAIHKIEKII